MAGWLLLALVLLNFETESSDGFGKLKGKHHRFVVCPFRDRRSHDKVARSDGFSPGQAMEQNLSTSGLGMGHVLPPGRILLRDWETLAPGRC